MTMQPIIDWMSFTIDAPLDKAGDVEWLDHNNKYLMLREVLMRVVQELGNDITRTLFGDLHGEPEVGRFPYKYAIQDNTSKAMIFFDPGLKHILIEVSGHGCKSLGMQSTHTILAHLGRNFSRLDVSTDIASDATPVEFISEGYSKRFTSTTIANSDNGQSIYVGSPKSDRQAVVYRYSEPHPRAHLLRIEHRFRRQQAKTMATHVAEHGLENAIALCGEIFAWGSPLWTPAVLGAVPLPKVDIAAKDSKVANWLLKQVFPAMKRYEREGVIPDLRAFVEEYLFGDDETP